MRLQSCSGEARNEDYQEHAVTDPPPLRGPGRRTCVPPINSHTQRCTHTHTQNTNTHKESNTYTESHTHTHCCQWGQNHGRCVLIWRVGGRKGHLSQLFWYLLGVIPCRVHMGWKSSVTLLYHSTHTHITHTPVETRTRSQNLYWQISLFYELHFAFIPSYLISSLFSWL